MREDKEKCLERDSKRIGKERKRRNGKGGKGKDRREGEGRKR
jgi:hypothetical protein